MSNQVVISGTDLRAMLRGAGVPNGAIYMGDDAYVAPRSDWLLGEFDRWFGSLIDTLDLGYSVEAWDCDDFSDLYSALARVSHRRTPDAVVGHGLPVGIMHFLSPAGPHAIVLAYTSDKGLLGIEPQARGRTVELKETAFRSCWLLKI